MKGKENRSTAYLYIYSITGGGFFTHTPPRGQHNSLRRLLLDTDQDFPFLGIQSANYPSDEWWWWLVGWWCGGCGIGGLGEP